MASKSPGGDPKSKFDWDLVVIGGGSGGLACSKRAARHGKKVACFDFVKPSPAGSTWGLGGTCVNVGCIPKKLFHTASLLGEALLDAEKYGWLMGGDAGCTPQHNWDALADAVQNYICSLNFGYKNSLRKEGVVYKNALAQFVGPHQIQATSANGERETYTAERFVICVGGRPKYPDIPGAKEYGISSDDVFSLVKPPGKTLVVGASYVALECAGFLVGLGYPVVVMVRSILLRGFDQEMAEQIGNHMKDRGTKFVRPASPTRVEVSPVNPEQKRVFWKMANGDGQQEFFDDFDTVLFAIGRDPDTQGLGLDKAGVRMESNGKLKTVNEQTNVPHVFALGDVLYGKLELTPVAIQAGRLLADRLYGGSQLQMQYHLVPTTVFTPLEYGCCGFTEEDAEQHFGKNAIEVFHSYVTPLEYTVAERGDNVVFTKLICHKSDSLRVVGFHVLSPHAGEITQGFALALKLGATKADFDHLVGIHPTVAEEFTQMHVTKASGASPKKEGC